MKHVHAELMALYAQDAMETDKPWERWEASPHQQFDFEPLFSHPMWDEESQYRRKPRTIKVNGFDVPELVTNSLKVNDYYWLADPTCNNYTRQLRWCNDNMDLFWLTRGLIHSTKEAAVKHAMAMCGIDPASV